MPGNKTQSETRARIDLNADLGEGYDDDVALLDIVSSCSVACGGHAGDQQSVMATISAAHTRGVAVGAHPGYPDRDGFGRISGFLRGDALYRSLTEQVRLCSDTAVQIGVPLVHVKPHGALYNDAVHDAELATIIARVTAEVHGHASLIGMAGSELALAAEQQQIEFVAEAFVDRAYQPDGTLVPRDRPGAVHTDLNVATTQATTLALHGTAMSQSGAEIDVAAETLCIHGDTDGAAATARAVRDVLESHGVEIVAHAHR